MPYLEGPQARHHGQLTHTVEADSGERQVIGLVYDPSRVAKARIGDELLDCLRDVHRQWADRASAVMAGLSEPWANWDQWEPWDAVRALVARYPGDVLPLPTLYPDPPPDPRGWWYESDAERRARVAREESLEKGAYIAESIKRGRPDWAVEGEGGDR